MFPLRLLIHRFLNLPITVCEEPGKLDAALISLAVRKGPIELFGSVIDVQDGENIPVVRRSTHYLQFLVTSTRQRAVKSWHFITMQETPIGIAPGSQLANYSALMQQSHVTSASLQQSNFALSASQMIEQVTTPSSAAAAATTSSCTNSIQGNGNVMGYTVPSSGVTGDYQHCDAGATAVWGTRLNADSNWSHHGFPTIADNFGTSLKYTYSLKFRFSTNQKAPLCNMKAQVSIIIGYAIERQLAKRHGAGNPILSRSVDHRFSFRSCPVFLQAMGERTLESTLMLIFLRNNILLPNGLQLTSSKVLTKNWIVGTAGSYGLARSMCTSVPRKKINTFASAHISQHSGYRNT
ncbi:hypothetical protein ANN_14326 [Periplaneta americana]|uniref:Uncharacterized protein n=1 Tax=Periplaneta americana TaxID=6978 RepID=A0ABQ8SX79_PERAM|nr:hypothetical protein ANN_14326 [Periplaneta americana]